MFEHVGVNHFRTFFDKSATLLKPDGVMLLHTIGRSGVPWATSAFIRKYIFPGGYNPLAIGGDCRRSRSRASSSPTSRSCACIMPIRSSTGRALCRQPRQGKGDLRRALLPHVEFYLAASEAAFRWQDLVIFQIQITKKNDTLLSRATTWPNAKRRWRCATWAIARRLPSKRARRPSQLAAAGLLARNSIAACHCRPMSGKGFVTTRPFS